MPVSVVVPMGTITNFCARSLPFVQLVAHDKAGENGTSIRVFFMNCVVRCKHLLNMEHKTPQTCKFVVPQAGDVIRCCTDRDVFCKLSALLATADGSAATSTLPLKTF